MRILNAKHLPWLIFVCLATIGASILYVGNFHASRLPSWIRLAPWLTQTPRQHQTVGGTPLGLAFGAISLGIFVFAALLSLRKRIPFWRPATVQRWLRAHIWLTLLTIPLIILHSGFRVGGPMTTLLMLMYAVVMVSGIYGLILQNFIPILMLEWLPAETVFEQIPHIRAQLVAAAEKMRDSFLPTPPKETDAGIAATPSVVKTITVGAPAMISKERHLSTPTARAKTVVGSNVTAEPVTSGAPATCGPSKLSADPIPRVYAAGGETVPSLAASEVVLAEFIEDQILPYLRAKSGKKLRLGNTRHSDDIFLFVRLHVAEGYRTRVEEIQAWCDERRMLDLQTVLHHWLHGWLFLHVPVSFLLLVMSGWHAFEALFSYG